MTSQNTFLRIAALFAAPLAASLVPSSGLATGADRSAHYVIQNFPILERLEASGHKLSGGTKDWMKKWQGLDLEDGALYSFRELSGSSSINMKIRKADASDPKGYKSVGSFVPRNSGANPNIEVASFNLAAILGEDANFRPAAPYDLGEDAGEAFAALINRAGIHGNLRVENKASILKSIASRRLVPGCVKAKKSDTAFAVEDVADPRSGPLGAPRSSHPIVRLIQASNPRPVAGVSVKLAKGFDGDALSLARELSVQMTVDVIFEQWDRYSGGNITVRKDKEGRAHFYSTDNGGASLMGSNRAANRNASYFSRYDRNVIAKLKELARFLAKPATGFLGYTDSAKFVVDLGLRTEAAPAVYAQRLKRNIDQFLLHVSSVEKTYGEAAYF